MSGASSVFGRREVALLAAVVLLWGIFAALSPPFRNAEVILDQSRFWIEMGLLAVGMLPVILIGGIDLSCASILALCGVTIVRLHAEAGVPIGWAAAIGLALGAAAGALNGALMVIARIPDLVVTLAAMAIYRGLAQVVSQNRVHSNLPEGYRYFGEGLLPGGVPVQWAVFLAAWGAVFVLLHATRFGRRTYALGANPTAARFARVPAARVRIAAYALSGLAAAAAAVIHTARSNTARSDDAVGLELEAITCLVLGGASISGGRGSAAGVLLAVLALGLLRSGMTLARVPSLYQRCATGAILIVLAAVNERLAGRGGK